MGAQPGGIDRAMTTRGHIRESIETFELLPLEGAMTAMELLVLTDGKLRLLPLEGAMTA
jgi:hypothetical protein